MSRTSWGFPKGKVNKDESAFDCAIREVGMSDVHIKMLYQDYTLTCNPTCTRILI